MQLYSIFLSIFFLGILSFYKGSAQGQFNAFGSAVNQGNNCFQLTPDALAQAGTIWNTTQLNLNCPFDYTYNVYLGTKDPNGADGIVFVLQQGGPNVVGQAGGAIGYGGISPSLAIEIDTWDNGPGANDIPCDHVAIHYNGSVANILSGPVQASASNCNIEDGQYHSFRVVWNPQTFTLQVYFDGVLRLTLNQNIIQTIFNNNPMVWWGFTAATGGASNQQIVCPTFLQTETICQNSQVTVHYTGITMQNPTYNWTWSGANVTPGTGPGPHTVSWSTPGNKTVSLVITSPSCPGGYNAMHKIYSVLPIPNPSIGLNPTSACPNQAVQVSFTGQANQGATYAWNFGAGASPATASGQGPHSVNWNSSGTKTITLTVTNPGNPACSAQTTQTVNILSNCQTLTSCPNIYTKVTAIDLCTNTLTVTSSSGFNVGDRVLLIQMKGATIDQTNTASYGNITAYNSAGNYEFQTISAIAGNNITLQHQLVRTYDPAHFVQLVKVGVYNNVVTQGTITCPAWDAATGTGGVMVMDVSGMLALGGTIHMNGAGFRGGVTNANQAGSHPCISLTPFFLPATTPDAAEKGEGIAHWIVNQEHARGKLANGGGGGNSHNHGGGGGGNMGTGGVGGYWNGCAPNPGGVGGINLLYNNVQNKIFLGGGGGGGQQNNSFGSSGGRGGGIIILKSGSIVSNNNTIQSNGQDGFNTPGGGNDGAGGGGAGGTILLDVSTFTGNLNINVNGGKGGNSCCSHGPGGGGGGGIVWSTGPLPTNVNVTVAPGANGVETGNNPMLAAPGTPGGTLTGLN
ncbi:MAG: hypothetical protein NZ576_09920, partial [Bacteroidia bacterium]|nr:hypothetical protein [Bacteroidia bacterium]